MARKHGNDVLGDTTKVSFERNKKLQSLKGEKRLRFIHKVLENSGGKI